jgi:cellulose synthase/poly-beta-1,6-N-acetylglucosamine synthase-like glycosyltransferase
MVFVVLLLFLLAAVLLVPMLVLIGETLCALLPRRASLAGTTRPRCAVLIPAHNEEGGIVATVAALKPQLLEGDRILVVADNCKDGTKQVAEAAGAEVVERHEPDTTKRGKGYALDLGVTELAKAPPEVVVIVDADCRVHEGALDQLVRQTAATGRPAQALYVMAAPPGPDPKQKLSAFAFLFKNVIRPTGLDRLGFPCLLTGTGMAFPWGVLRGTRLASGNIVEDMQMGIDMALAGTPPRLCLEARVSSELPVGGAAAKKQRARWEHGHVRTMLTQAPRLLLASLRQMRCDLFGLGLELSVPPLSLLFLGAALVLAAALLSWYADGSPGPALLLLGGIAGVGLSILAAWANFGREMLPLWALMLAPVYVLWKVPIYLALLVGRVSGWVRAERPAEAAGQPAPATPPAERG